MKLCSSIKANGEPCQAPAMEPHGLCWAHDPQNADERRRMASHASKARKNTEAKQLKDELKQLKDDVLAGEVDRRDADTVVKIYNVIKGFIELERGIKEQDELVAEIEELKREYGNAS